MRKTTLGVLAVAAVAAAGFVASAVAAKLDTSAVFGTWAGTWTNKRFGSTGTITVVITDLGGDSADFQWTITGGVFGCGPVDTTHGVLLRGEGDCGGDACFTDTTVTVNGSDSTFGETVTIKGKKNGKFTAKGTNTCNGVGPRSYRAKAKYKGTSVKGKMKIQTSSGPATTTFEVLKQL
jgi:hypothetical protein